MGDRPMLGSQLLMTPTVDSSNFLLNRYIKCGLLFRNAVGDSKIELPIKPIMQER